MKNRFLTKYFHPRAFVGNNIEYRIGSSAALARFKESQTYLLNQVAFNPYHTFSYTAKEILLLKYDVCFDLLCEIEQYILVEQANVNYRDIKLLIGKRARYLSDVMRSEKTIDQEYYKIWEDISSLNADYFKGGILGIVNSGMHLSSVFGSLVDLFIVLMNHSLYELQEIDSVYYSKETPSFILDNLSCNMKHSTNECVIIERIELLMKVRWFDKIMVKNYLDISVPFNATPLYGYLENAEIKYTLV